MKTFLVLWALFVGSFGAPAGSCKNPLTGKLAAFRKELVESLDELDEATAEVINLEHDIHEKSTKGRAVMAEIDVLEYQIDHLKGEGHCNDHQFWCGGDSIECVDKIAVCDNIKDCGSGHDEDHCEEPTPAGSVWKGTVVYDHCTKRKPDSISFTIEDYKRSEFFPSRPEIDVTIHIERSASQGHGHWALVSHATYNFADHKLIIQPPESDRLGLICEFDGVHVDHCDGHVVHEATLEPCAEFYFSRE